MNPNQSGTNFSNPNQSNLRFIRIDSDCKFGFDQHRARIDSDSKLGFGLVWIHSDCCLGLNRIWSYHFLPFFIKRVTKRFSILFGMIRIGSDTDIGMNRNSSDCLGMNSHPILSPRYLYSI